MPYPTIILTRSFFIQPWQQRTSHE